MATYHQHLWPTKITIELFQILALVLRVPALASPSRDQVVRVRCQFGGADVDAEGKEVRLRAAVDRKLQPHVPAFRLLQGRLIGLGSAV